MIYIKYTFTFVLYYINMSTLCNSHSTLVYHTNKDYYHYYQFSDSIVLYAGEFPINKAINLKQSKTRIGPEYCEKCFNCGNLNGLIIGLCYNCQYNYDQNFHTNDLCLCHNKGCVQSLYWDVCCDRSNCIYFKYKNTNAIYNNDYSNNIIRSIIYNNDDKSCNKSLHKIFLCNKESKRNYSLATITRDPLLNCGIYLDDLHKIR